MNNEIRNIFIEALSTTKNSEANKADILKLGKNMGL